MLKRDFFKSIFGATAAKMVEIPKPVVKPLYKIGTYVYTPFKALSLVDKLKYISNAKDDYLKQLESSSKKKPDSINKRSSNFQAANKAELLTLHLTRSKNKQDFNKKFQKYYKLQYLLWKQRRANNLRKKIHLIETRPLFVLEKIMEKILKKDFDFSYGNFFINEILSEMIGGESYKTKDILETWA